MSSKKQIQKKDWQDRLQSLVSGNRNRVSSIVVDGNKLVESKAFLGLDYDPIAKGNDIVISVKDYIHTVDAPTELSISEASNGVVNSVEINNLNGVVTILSFLV